MSRDLSVGSAPSPHRFTIVKVPMSIVYGCERMTKVVEVHHSGLITGAGEPEGSEGGDHR